MSDPISVLRDFQFRLEYVALRAIVGIVRAAPLDTASAVSGRAWRYLAPKITPKRHIRALANLAIAFPDMPPAEREKIALANWENLGRVMAETMQMDRILRDPKRIEIANLQVFARYRDKLGPVVGVSLHMGNWELAIWPLTLAGANPAAVYRSVNNPYVDQYLRYQRRDLYPRRAARARQGRGRSRRRQKDRAVHHGLCAARRTARHGRRPV